MLFNSIEFAVFLPIVFILYWFVFQKSLKWQNLFIVITSYIFYGWWDWRFLFLILFSTVQDYCIAYWIEKENSQKKRKLLLSISIITNLGFLGFFKYYNFFLDNFITAFSFFGTKPSIHTLNILLPVGISFYTFQTLSYTIDVYRRNLTATKDFIAFSAFVSFFPQLVAGPIERATHLLPQFYKKRNFNYNLAVDGMRQILWGLFKKMVIADNCAIYANQIFANYETSSGSELVLGAVFFAFQIYGDFSGYSDIAIGTSRLFGFDFPEFNGDYIFIDEHTLLHLEDTPIAIRFVPGHSPGSIAFYIESQDMIISGDALFRRSIGRTDLYKGDYDQLLASIRTQLLTLPEQTQVYSGHGMPTTIGEEKRLNPFLQA